MVICNYYIFFRNCQDIETNKETFGHTIKSACTKHWSPVIVLSILKQPQTLITSANPWHKCFLKLHQVLSLGQMLALLGFSLFLNQYLVYLRPFLAAQYIAKAHNITLSTDILSIRQFDLPVVRIVYCYI